MESVYLLVALGAIVAGFVQGLSGFAFGMVAMSQKRWRLVLTRWQSGPHQ